MISQSCYYRFLIGRNSALQDPPSCPYAVALPPYTLRLLRIAPQPSPEARAFPQPRNGAAPRPRQVLWLCSFHQLFPLFFRDKTMRRKRELLPAPHFVARRPPAPKVRKPNSTNKRPASQDAAAAPPPRQLAAINADCAPDNSGPEGGLRSRHCLAGADSCRLGSDSWRAGTPPTEVPVLLSAYAHAATLCRS